MFLIFCLFASAGALRIGTMRSLKMSSSAGPVLNKFSKTITEPPSQGASQAMLYATGLTPETMKNPQVCQFYLNAKIIIFNLIFQVGICSVWFEGNPCNMHLLDLSGDVKAGVKEAGLTGYRFNTIGVSDGISMGTDGMSYSLQSRDVIADSIETTMGGQWYDALVTIPGCDKNMPGCLIAMGRLNRPSLMVYGGTIRAGCSKRFPQVCLLILSEIIFKSFFVFIYIYFIFSWISFQLSKLMVKRCMIESLKKKESILSEILAQALGLVVECIPPILWPLLLKPWVWPYHILQVPQPMII